MNQDRSEFVMESVLRGSALKALPEPFREF